MYEMFHSKIPEDVKEKIRNDMSIAGNILFSDIFLSNIVSLFPVPLNSSNITSSILLPVSISAVAIIVNDPP